jgi:hypothetical protein
MRCHRPRCLAKQRYAPHPGEVEALIEAAMARACPYKTVSRLAEGLAVAKEAQAE